MPERPRCAAALKGVGSSTGLGNKGGYQMHRSRGLWWSMGAGARRSLTLAWTALFILSLLMQAGALASPSSALAVHDEGLFELDGNAVNDPAVAGDDWNQVFNGTSNAQSTQFITDKVNDQTDDTFKGNTGDD